MKADFHFHFYSRIVIMAALALFILSWQKSMDTVAQEAQGISVEIGGWAWSELTGWISLNCHNDFNGDGMTTSRCADAGGVNYGLEVYRDFSDNKYIKGCAWSGNPIQGSGQCSIGSLPCIGDFECPGVETCEFVTLGYICFSEPGAGTTYAPIDGVRTLNSSSTVNALCSQEIDGVPICNILDSYGSIISLEDHADPSFEGWKFGFPIENEVSAITETDYPSASNPIEGCFNCHEDFIYNCSLGSPEYYCRIGGSACTCDPGDDSCQDFVNCTEVGDALHFCDVSYASVACDCDPGLSSCVDAVNCPDIAGTSQTCDAIDIQRKCENCLEYFYYNGACSNDQSLCSTDDDCGGPADICEIVSTCEDNIETICKYSGGAYLGNCATEQDCVEREVGSLKKVLGAYSCSSCNIENLDNTCGVNPYKSNINSCDLCTDVYRTPGVMLDNKYNSIQSIAAQACDPSQTDPKADDFCQRAALCGWAWNSWAAGVYGLGWFQFEPRIVTSSKPYLFVEGGNIYSKGNVLGRYSPPYGKYNSSYLIESGGRISNFVSSSTLAGFFQGELSYRPDINFLNLIGNKYQNALGTIDYVGLITDFGGGLNKFGSEIVEFEDLPVDVAAVQVALNNRLADRVLWVKGSLETSGAIEIKNGKIPGGAGSGIVVVEGNLYITRDITYADHPSLPDPDYENLKEIPSIVWIVRGDLYIDPVVTELAGTFVVLGDGTSLDDPPCSGDPVHAGCGQVVTAFPSDTFGLPLVINGSVIARRFDLGRVYHTNNEPAERFVNDGRLQANPPKGMSDFSRVVPRFE